MIPAASAERRAMFRAAFAALLMVVATACGSSDQITLGDPVTTTVTAVPDSPTTSAPSVPAVPVTAPEAPVTTDGITLGFDRFGEGTRAVVLAHEQGADRSSWTSFATTLAAAGHLVLVPDFRGHGESPGEAGTNLDLDLVAVVDHAREIGATEIVLVGASTGGTAALAMADDVGAIGVVSLSSPNTVAGLDALTAASGLAIPTLFFVAEDDNPHVEQVSVQATAAGDEPQVFGGSAHGTALLDEHGTAIESQIVAFVANI